MSDEITLEPLRIDSKLWSHRDLLERIISRHFHILDEASGVDLGWQVKLPDMIDNPTIALDSLNAHLRDLSWIALLQEGEPYDLIILPEPPMAEGLSNKQMVAVWLVFALFLTLSGGAWLQLQQPDVTLLTKSLLMESLLWFTAPVLVVMLLASEIRRRIGLSNGVDLRHHLPISIPLLMTPTNPIWPFGIIGFMSQRRMDLMPFRDRRSLTIISFSGPFIMILFGIIFTVIGFMRTSLDAPHYQTSPVIVEPSIFVEFIISLFMSSEHVSLRSTWLHPLGLAGITLTIFGWILLLPIPGFPGDRMLTGLIGPEEMSEGGTQTQLFVSLLLTGILLLYFGAFFPLLFLVGLGAWRRFSPESNAAPFVLNEIDEFDDKQRLRIGLGAFLILLLLFPGVNPVTPMNDWDGGLDTSEWPTEVIYSTNEQSALELPLSVIGVLPLNIDFHFSFEGNPGVFEWNFCSENLTFDYLNSCTVNNINIVNDELFLIEYRAPLLGSQGAPFSLMINWLEGEDTKSHQISFFSESTPSPANSSWSWNGDYDVPEYCIDLNLDEEKSGNLTIESPLYTFSGESRIPLLVGEKQTVCIDGLYGSGRTISHYVGPNHLLHPPPLVATLDDGTILNWQMGVEEQYLEIFSGEWPASKLFEDRHSYLIWVNLNQEPSCSLDLPNLDQEWQLISGSEWNQADSNGTWVWDLEEVSKGLHTPQSPAALNGTIIIPQEGKVIRCYGSQLHDIYLISPASSSLASFSGMDVAGVDNTSITNFGSGPIFLEVKTATSGVSSNLNLSSRTLQPGEMWNLSIPQFSVNNTMQHIVWLEPQSDRWVLHAVTHCITPEGCGSGEE
jgi:hypothetical protein